MRAGWLAAALIAAAQPPVWTSAATGYAGDDFWTLGAAQRLGLLVISGLLASALFVAGAALSRRVARLSLAWRGRAALDAGLRGAAFLALHWLSPQLYYAYYRSIIPGLPAQWVLRAPDVDATLAALSFAAGGRAAEHLGAAIFWGLVLAGLWAQIRGTRARVVAAAAVAACPWALRLAFD